MNAQTSARRAAPDLDSAVPADQLPIERTLAYIQSAKSRIGLKTGEAIVLKKSIPPLL
jgi:hypothetical protein